MNYITRATAAFVGTTAIAIPLDPRLPPGPVRFQVTLGTSDLGATVTAAIYESIDPAGTAKWRVLTGYANLGAATTVGTITVPGQALLLTATISGSAPGVGYSVYQPGYFNW